MTADQTRRTPARGYARSQVRQGFTGYERDSETGLDYARARYYAGAQGRFAGVDPLLSSGRASSPQTWNRYSYALNNPLRFNDPSGKTADDTERQPQTPRRNRSPRPLTFVATQLLIMNSTIYGRTPNLSPRARPSSCPVLSDRGRNLRH